MAESCSTAKGQNRSRSWEQKETEVLLEKWGQPNMQERIKSCTRKKPIWEEIAVGVRAEGYEDRGGDQCQTRIKTLTVAYKKFIDNKRQTGMQRSKKPPCFDTLDAILGDKPTVMPSSLISSLPFSSTSFARSESELRPTISTLCESFDENTAVPSVSLHANEEEMFSDQFAQPKGGQSPSLAPYQGLTCETETIPLSSTTTPEEDKQNMSSGKPVCKELYFSKTNKKRKRNTTQSMVDTLQQSLNEFIRQQQENDTQFLSQILQKEEDEATKKNVDDERVLKVRLAGDEDFIEVEVQQNCSMVELKEIICNELDIKAGDIMKIRKLPNTLLRNEKDIKRLRDQQEIEVVLHEDLVQNDVKGLVFVS